MRQFALWNKPITPLLNRLKWQIKCLRHSPLIWIHQTAGIHGFPLYLYLPSGCFGFLELWKLKWGYLCIVSSKVKVRTVGRVHSHSMLEWQWYWLIGSFRNLTDGLNTHGVGANKKWLQSRSTWIQHISCRTKQNWCKTRKSGIDQNSDNHLIHARKWCCRCRQGRESLGGHVPMTAAKFSCGECSWLPFKALAKS